MTLFRIFAFIALTGCILFSDLDQPKLIAFTSSECLKDSDSPNLYDFQNRILKISKIQSIHLYEIFVVTNCNLASSGEISIENDTLNLKYSGTHYNVKYETVDPDSGEKKIVETTIIEQLECDCAFKLTYKIKGLEDKDYVVLANGNRIFKTNHKYKIRRKKPQFDVINNDTINMVDIYGFKQGLHISYSKEGRLRSKIIFKDNERVSGLIFTKYNFGGYDKAELYMKDGEHSKQHYYKDNRLIKMCDIDDGFEESNCVYFD